jgi:hypothetical protein
VFTPLLFPTGRLLSPRWRPVAWLAGVTTAVLTALTSLRTELGTVEDQVIANPIGVAAVGNPENSPLVPALIVLLGVLATAAFGSLVLRFRRSRGEERQQLKWFTYASARASGRPCLWGPHRVPAGRGRDRDPAPPAL